MGILSLFNDSSSVSKRMKSLDVGHRFPRTQELFVNVAFKAAQCGLTITATCLLFNYAIGAFFSGPKSQVRGGKPGMSGGPRGRNVSVKL